jgi:hypothetical protein
MSDDENVIECPCCHGAGELEVTSEDTSRSAYYVCTHCMGKRWVRKDSFKLEKSK